jgi:hypothetical protein
MSALDWLQMFIGFRYCLRRVIIAVTLLLACRTKLMTAEAAESAE